MKLIMTETRPEKALRHQIVEELDSHLAFINYDGLSTKEIEFNLSMELDDDVSIVTADSRFLKFVRSGGVFTLDDVFIYRDGEIRNIKDTTLRILHDGHSLMKLYESGEFELDTGKSKQKKMNEITH